MAGPMAVVVMMPALELRLLFFLFLVLGFSHIGNVGFRVRTQECVALCYLFLTVINGIKRKRSYSFFKGCFFVCKNRLKRHGIGLNAFDLLSFKVLMYFP